MDKSQEHVTHRRRLQRSKSIDRSRFLNTSMDNTLDNTTIFDTTMKSLPNTSSLDDSTYTELKVQVEELSSQLVLANKNIENLNLQNNTLKTEIINVKKLLHTYKILIPDIELQEHVKYMNTAPSVEINSKHDKAPQYTSTQEETKQRDNTIDKNLTNSHTEGVRPPQIDCKKKNCDYIYKKSNIIIKKTQNNQKIMILGDQQALGLSKLLSKKLSNKKCCITSFIKPDATCHDVLNTNLHNNFTKDDYLILLIGANDKIPTNIICALSVFLAQSPNTHIFLIQTMINPYLNINMLNNQLKLISKIYKNCKYIGLSENSRFNANYLHDIYSRIKLEMEAISYYKLSIEKIKYHKSNMSNIDKFDILRRTKGTIPYYFLKNPNELNKKSNKQNNKSIEYQQIKAQKGTIPYYFNKKNDIGSNLEKYLFRHATKL
ncbi:unnamed protein product [Diatraea saccharalis]|uniref:Uncharacterized protein n=1 Tax=Diatraea saccharalis TaxID=40085 RepID=A0A9N9QT27_9NEOP|nr:unnamed protein product [Diatraea saccharalis]